MLAGKLLIFSGLLLVAIGVLVTLSPKFPWLGHLPGDLLVQRERFTFYFPLATSLLLSFLLTLLIKLFSKR